MLDATEPVPPPSYKNSDAAPFIYFGFAPTFGVLGGVIQVELAARTLIPGSPQVGVELVLTAHLQYSPAVACELKRALEEALQMLERPQDGLTAGSKLN